MRREFIVGVELPPGVRVTEMTDYIRQAVQTWCGSFNPEDDPLFHLDVKSVTVRPAPKKPKKKLTRRK